MKKIILGLTVLTLTLSAMAQDESKDKKSWGRERKEMRGGDHGNMMDMMEKLNLTEDQKAKMKVINEDTKKEREALKSQKFSEEVMKEKRIAIMNKRKEKIAAILTPEQKKKWEEMKQNKGEMDHDKGDKDHNQGDKKESRDERFGAMVKELNLTADQSAKFKELQSSLRTKIKDIKSNTTLTEEQKKSEMKDVFKNHKKSVEEILTPEQRKQMKVNFKQHKHEGEE